MLTLAAMSVMTNSGDPFFTQLGAGAYASRKPSGTPCDDAYPCAGMGVGLPEGGKIGLAVVVTVFGLLILGLWAYWLFAWMRSKEKV